MAKTLVGVGRGVCLTSEQFCPTRFIVGREKPSRQTLADHVRALRRIRPGLGQEFRNHALWVGFWPVSWARADGTRYRSQADEPAPVRGILADYVLS